MLMRYWPKISSDFICIYDKIAGGQGLAPDAIGGAHNAPPDPQIGPLTARAWSTRTLLFAHSALIPDYGAQIMVP